MKVTLTALVILALSFAACGEKPPAEIVQKPSQDAELEKRLAEMEQPRPISWLDTNEEIIEKFQPEECADCPKSIGQMVALREITKNEKGKDVYWASNCQGGLSSEDEFLASRHCLPDELVNVGASCSEKIKIILPRLGKDLPAEVVECDEITALSPSYPNLPITYPQDDWVVLKLKKSFPDRAPSIDLNGIEDQQKIFSFVPVNDPQTGNFKIRKITCVSMQNSIDMPFHYSSKSILVYLQCDREMTKGFSGMNLFSFSKDKGYSLIATLSHIDPKPPTVATSQKEPKQPIEISNIGVVNNAHCIFSKEDEEKPKSCVFDPQQEEVLINKVLAREYPRFSGLLDKKLDKWLSNHNPEIAWVRVTKETLEKSPDHYQDAIKTCIKNKREGNTEEERLEYCLGTSPIYPKCLKSKKLKKIFIPDIVYQLDRRNLGILQTKLKIKKRRAKLEKINHSNHYQIKISPPQEIQQANNLNFIYLRGQYLNLINLPLCK